MSITFSGLPLLLATLAGATSDHVITIIRPIELGPIPVSATVVVQDTASWLVTEFTGPIGCNDIQVDSIRMGNLAKVKVGWSEPVVKLDSASALGCQKVKRARRVDRLPEIVVATSGSSSYRLANIPDSVGYCNGAACRTLSTRVVLTPMDDHNKCMEGVLPPFGTHAQAVDYLRSRLAASRATLRLNRMILVELMKTAVVDTVSNKLVPCLDPAISVLPKSGMPSWPSYLTNLSAWNDPRVPADFALPSPGNAADLFGEESLHFFVDTLSLVSQFPKISVAPSLRLGPQTWSYVTGRKGYLYKGAGQGIGKCGGWYSSGREIFRDTLATDGENLLITNQQPVCGRQDIDAFAATRSQWLVMLPITGEPLEVAFRHYSSVETGWSWPLEGDSILVRNQKVAIAELEKTAGVSPSVARPAGLQISLSGRSLAVVLDQAADVRLMDATGRILLRTASPQGASAIRLPQGVRGLVVVQAGAAMQTVVVP